MPDFCQHQREAMEEAVLQEFPSGVRGQGRNLIANFLKFFRSFGLGKISAGLIPLLLRNHIYKKMSLQYNVYMIRLYIIIYS
jgi:hypothetical protein